MFPTTSRADVAAAEVESMHAAQGASASNAARGRTQILIRRGTAGRQRCSKAECIRSPFAATLPQVTRQPAPPEAIGGAVSIYTLHSPMTFLRCGSFHG